MPQSLDIGHNSDGGIYCFRISGQSLIKANCHKSRTSDVIHIKLGPVTKLNKTNKMKSKTCDNEVMLGNYGDIVIFLIYGKFGALR